MVRMFTKKLADLFVNQEMELSEALEVIRFVPEKKGKRGRNKLAKTAEYFYQQLEAGNYISNAFRTCPYINFNDFYVSFISIFERYGDLRCAIDYLNKKCERHHKNVMKVFEAGIYPLFIIGVAVFSGLIFVHFTEEKNYELFVKIMAGFILISTGVFLIIFKILSENRLYEAFILIDFMMKSNVGIAEAVNCAVQILGKNTKYGRIFLDAKEKLGFGMSIQNALRLGDRFEEGFYFADKAGGKTEVFGKMAVWLYEQDENKRNICIRLMEPVFILLTGIFILILLLNFFMPLATNNNWL